MSAIARASSGIQPNTSIQMARSAKPRSTAVSVANARATVFAGSHVDGGVPTGAMAGLIETVIVEKRVRAESGVTRPWSGAVWVRTFEGARAIFGLAFVV